MEPGTRLSPPLRRTFGDVTLAGSTQVLNERETSVPAKTPVASVGGSTLTTDSVVAGGSVHGPPPAPDLEPHAARAPAKRTTPARLQGPTFIVFSGTGARGERTK